MLIVLLDADIIIDLHRFGIWEIILKKNNILIPSFEKLLKSSGITKNLEQKHTENYFKKYLDEGSILRIQRFGLKENGAE